jgi:hypothetical protein
MHQKSITTVQEEKLADPPNIGVTLAKILTTNGLHYNPINKASSFLLTM